MSKGLSVRREGGVSGTSTRGGGTSWGTKGGARGAVGVTVDASDFGRHAERLRRIQREVMPRAARKLLTSLAEGTTEASKGELRSQFVLRARNNWSLRSLRTQWAKGRNIERMYSVSGSVSPYLGAQEEGGSKANATLPTSVSAGQGRNAIPRTRLPTKAHDIHKLEVGPKFTPRNPSVSKARQQALVVRVKTRTGGVILWTSARGHTQTYRVRGGKPKKRRKKGESGLTSFKLEALHRVKVARVRWQATPWAHAASKGVLKRFDEFADAAMREAFKQLK